MGKVLLGGIVGGIIIFVWGAIAHMALPLGEAGMVQLPNEDKLAATLKEAIREPGLYIFPYMDRSKMGSEAEQNALHEKIKQGPTGLLVIQPNGDEGISPKRLLIELGSNIASALLAAIVLTQVRSGYLGRVLVVTLMGLFAFASINISYWNWYHFPAEFTIAAAIEETVGGLLAGLAMAAIARPAKKAVALE
jgi:hypothetical protein